MDRSLALRCRRFLEKPVPENIGYVPDSIAERILRLAAAGEAIDGEMAELLEICVMETRAAAEAHRGEARRWFDESARLLEEIGEGNDRR